MSEPKGFSPIAEFYRDKSVFVTGGTGFVGKVLLEKLLRSCSDIKNIYVLMRAKGQKSVEQRLDELLACQIFDRLRQERPSPLAKVQAVSGDIATPHLGLSPAHLELLVKNVSVIFHSAATVKFDEPLRISVQINLLGSKHVTEVAKMMKLLQSFVHVSTAYCNCDRETIDEIIYPPPVPPQLVIDTLQWIDDPLLESITPGLIKGRPNTYTFTKSLAESFLMEHCKELPLAIVRPSIVTAAWREPFKGWIDNMNGPTGMYLAASKGILRTMLMKPEIKADFIPVDTVINLMITVAWQTSIKEKPAGVTVYNCTSGSINAMTWKTMEAVTFAAMIANPSCEVFRYPNYKSTASRWSLMATSMVHHYIPASLVDACALIRGKKPRMIRLYQKIHKAVDTLEFFTMHEWKFGMGNTVGLVKKMNNFDQKTFNFDIGSLVWPDYMNNYILGIRKYLMKEEDSTLPIARSKLRTLYLKTQVINFLASMLFLRVAIQRSETFRRFWFTLVSYAFRLYNSLCILMP